MKTRGKPAVLWLRRVVLGALAALAILIVIFGRDIPPFDATDLIPQQQELAPEANAYDLLLTLTNVMVWPEDGTNIEALAREDVWDDALVAARLATNAAALAVLDEAIAVGAWQPPALVSVTDPLPYVTPLRRGALLLRLRAAAARRQQAPGTEQAQLCAAQVRFADMTLRGVNSMVSYLVAVAMLDIVRDSVSRLTTAPGVSERDLVPVLLALPPQERLQASLVRSLQGEYMAAAGLVDALAERRFRGNGLGGGGRIPAPPFYVFQPNATKALYARDLRRMIHRVPKPHAQQRLGPAVAIPPDDGMLALLRPNATGRLLHELLMPALDRVLARGCKAEAALSATRLTLALRMHALRHGELPDALDALKPDLLNAVPRDPFDGAPFRYDPARRLLYAIGENLVDNGGSTNALPGSTRGATLDIVYPLGL